jgi:methylglyoxal synthase
MNIALIADDSKKRLMENLGIAYRHILNKHILYATGTTGQIVEEAANLPVHKYLAGHLGGEQQLGSQIAHNDIDLVIVLRDPIPQRYSELQEMNPVTHLCDVHNIPLASNLATAEALLLALDRGDLDWRNIVK